MTNADTNTDTDTENGTPPLDPSSLSSQERINYILEIRRRVQEDAKSVTDDEIRDAVRMIRLNRAEPTKRGTSKTATPAVSLSDF